MIPDVNAIVIFSVFFRLLIMHYSDCAVTKSASPLSLELLFHSSFLTPLFLSYIRFNGNAKVFVDGLKSLTYFERQLYLQGRPSKWRNSSWKRVCGIVLEEDAIAYDWVGLTRWKHTINKGLKGGRLQCDVISSWSYSTGIFYKLMRLICFADIFWIMDHSSDLGITVIVRKVPKFPFQI